MRMGVAGLLVAGTLAVTACGQARNYDTPGGPTYFGGVAPQRVLQSHLRVVSFNVQYGRALFDVARVLAETPALQGADLILLQEVDLAATEYLAGTLGLTYLYVPASWHPVTDSDFGNAILSAWPIVSADKVLLPHVGRWRQNRRAAAAATVCVGASPVRVYSTHLSTVTEVGPGARKEQLGAVLDDADSYAVAIVGGDFNSGGVGDSAVARGFAWPTEDNGPTRGLWTIDHVVVRGVEPTEVGVVRLDEGVSDHHPIWADVRLLASPSDAACAVDGAARGGVPGRMRDAARAARAWMIAHGVRPGFGGIGRRSGTGPKLGVGWLADSAAARWVEVEGGVTTLGYWRLSGRMGHRLGPGPSAPVLELDAARTRRTQDQFFGLGNSTPDSAEADYALDTRQAGVTVHWPLGAGVTLGGFVAWAWHEAGPGRSDVPDVGTVFPSPPSGYGRVESLTLVGGRLQWTSGRPFSQARAGAWGGVDAGHVVRRSGGRPRFTPVHADVGLERPLLGRRGSLALELEYGGVWGTTDVPFYLMPALGGTPFPALPWDRFRHRELLAARVEARLRMWRPASDALWVDLIVFTTAGQVGDDVFAEFDPRLLHHGYGLAVGVVNAAGAVGRFGLSWGGHGVRPRLTIGSII